VAQVPQHTRQIGGRSRARLLAVNRALIGEALAGGISSRLVMGTMRGILEELTGRLVEQPYRAEM